MSQANPYAPIATHVPSSSTALPIAGQTKRFLTAILDNLVIFAMNYAMGLAVGIVLVATGGVSPEIAAALQIVLTLVGWVVALIYYTLLEATTGKTLGKMVMGTKVLSNDGSNATFGQCLGRSACRFIPFEAFSFLIGTNSRFPVGWHDRFAGTVVVSTR